MPYTTLNEVKLNEYPAKRSQSLLWIRLPGDLGAMQVTPKPLPLRERDGAALGETSRVERLQIYVAKVGGGGKPQHHRRTGRGELGKARKYLYRPIVREGQCTASATNGTTQSDRSLSSLLLSPILPRALNRTGISDQAVEQKRHPFIDDRRFVDPIYQPHGPEKNGIECLLARKNKPRSNQQKIRHESTPFPLSQPVGWEDGMGGRTGKTPVGAVK